MANPDTCCTLAPYFKVHEGQLENFKKGCGAFVERASTEPGCMFFAVTFDGDVAHCREGYESADAVLAHLDNVGDLIQESLKIADLIRLEVHAPAAELESLRGPLGQMNPQFFSLETGFRR